MYVMMPAARDAFAVAGSMVWTASKLVRVVLT